MCLSWWGGSVFLCQALLALLLVLVWSFIFPECVDFGLRVVDVRGAVCLVVNLWWIRMVFPRVVQHL